jgi:membrane-bound serine protease (ClpP class)
VIGGVAAVAAGFLLWAVTRFMSLRRRTPVYGARARERGVGGRDETFVDDHGHYRGHVRMSRRALAGRSDAPVMDGDPVQVLSVDGLTLRVRKT